MRKALAPIGLLLAACSLPSIAQSRLEPPDLDRYLRWGPFRLRPGFELSNLGHDDNIFVNDQNKVGDYRATLSPKVDGLMLFGSRGFLTFAERLDYTLYANNGDQNFLNHRGSARVTFPLRGIGVYADVRLSDAEARPADRQDIRAQYEQRRAGAGVIVQPGWRTEIQLGWSHADLSHSDVDAPTISDRLDRSEGSWSLEADYRVRGRTRLTLEGQLKSIDFDTSAGGQSDTHESRWLGGVDFGIGGPVSGSFKVGWAWIDAEDLQRPDLSEAIGEIELAYRFTSRTRVRLVGARLPGFAITGGNTYYLDTTYAQRTVHYLNRVVGLEFGASTGKLTFPESTSGTLREDRLRRVEGGVRLRLSADAHVRRVEYAFKIGRYRRDSNVDSADLSQSYFSLGAVLGY